MERIKSLLRTGANKLHFDAIVIGSGMAGLTAAALLTQKGMQVLVLEANYLPGGCTSSYYRKGYWFESGATTLVGLGGNMPLQHVLGQTGIEIPAWHLDVPMMVHTPNATLTRHENLNEWIQETQNTFGGQQEAFWKHCMKISEFVWENSLNQLHFPPENLTDLIQTAKQAKLNQLKSLPLALKSTTSLLQEFKLANKPEFIKFVNEQLMITAQNTAPEVNQLFGATALCYTNYPNYYVPGGLINMITPFVQYLIKNGSDYRSRQPVTFIERDGNGYLIHTETHQFKSAKLISAIPLNNTLSLLDPKLQHTINRKQILKQDKLSSAYQLNLAFKRKDHYDAIHHQILLGEKLPGLNSGSIFLSMNHPDDNTRGPEGITVASVTTHIPINPQAQKPDHNQINKAIIEILENKGFLKADEISYMHSADQDTWQQWTRREWGFVGGYPQFLQTKPWQMNGHRLIDNSLYVCGDSTYPGQGIPGATLSGIIASNKLLADQ